jgi:hypothetical protein
MGHPSIECMSFRTSLDIDRDRRRSSLAIVLLLAAALLTGSARVAGLGGLGLRSGTGESTHRPPSPRAPPPSPSAQ